MRSNSSNEVDRGVSSAAGDFANIGGDTKFVRGGVQLAVYRPAWNQTGHVLTSREAQEAYGYDTIVEALEFGSAILRETPTSTEDALKERREDLGLESRAVALAAGVPIEQIALAESQASKVPIRNLEKIAFVLGLDERFVAFKSDCGGDADLGVRLKVLHREPSSETRINQRGAIILSEAASVIRVQHRLQNWLSLPSERDKFVADTDYGSAQNPAWRIGYRLARDTRSKLALGQDPIQSMRELVEKRLCIPVVQAQMNADIAGATVTNTDESGNEVRGIVLNISGENENIWVRRATLAHELGHLLYDPSGALEKVRVDFYRDNQENAETNAYADYVEQRANAFAIAFLAPVESVRDIVSTPVTEDDVSNVMSTFGISHTAAKYHIGNCLYRRFAIPERFPNTMPSDEQKAAENFTTDYFPIHATPHQRRGKFSGLVAAACQNGLISEQTAALYLHGDEEEIRSVCNDLRSLFEV